MPLRKGRPSVSWFRMETGENCCGTHAPPPPSSSAHAIHGFSECWRLAQSSLCEGIAPGRAGSPAVDTHPPGAGLRRTLPTTALAGAHRSTFHPESHGARRLLFMLGTLRMDVPV